MNKLTTLAVMISLSLGITACNNENTSNTVKPTIAAPNEAADVTNDVKVDAVDTAIELEPVAEPKGAVLEAKEPSKKAIEVKKEEVKSGANALKIIKSVDGETTYAGTTTVTGTLEYSRTNYESFCEICFYFDEKSAKAIPKPTPDDNRPAIAIAYSDSEILGLSVNENECLSVPMELEITDFVGVSGGNFSDARILKATKTGEATIEACD